MIRTCIIDTADDIVINIIEYDELPSDTPPGYDERMIAVASDTAQIGWLHDDGDLSPPPIAPEILERNYRDAALAALNKTDSVAIRCLKADVEYPAEWVSYTEILRDIVSTLEIDTDEPLPIQPDYPLGS
jgi:hypothetical protein